MIDIKKAKEAFKQFLEKYNNQEDLGFELKVVHTYQVAENSKQLARAMNLPPEEIALAELIGLLHDIGRFEELKILKKFDSVNFDHAEHGVKMLFQDNLIRKFIKEEKQDKIIQTAIRNHNKYSIEGGLDKETLLQCKIIRDSDKLDNFRVKREEKIEAIFPQIIKKKEEIENALLSEPVYQAILKKEMVNVVDRKTPLDYWVCILAFVFDLNFPISYQIVKQRDDINQLIDRFDYKIEETRIKMEAIREKIEEYVRNQLES